MQKVSALIFSRNNVKELLELIDDIYDSVDQIVIIDSSSRGKFSFLKSQEKKFRKLKAYHFVALGYLEPSRPYGLKKCRYNRIIHLDVDERLSQDLKKDLRKIEFRNGTKAFRIKRFENRSDISSKAISSWQIRLYDKRFVEYKGLNHEFPIVRGFIGRLQDGYFISHLPHNAKRHYSLLEKLEEFNRLTYGILNEKISNGNNGAASSLLKGYEAIAMKKKDQELSNFDYFIFNMSKEVLMPFLKGEVGFNLTVNNYRQVRKKLNSIKEWKRQENGKISLDISKRIFRQGIVKYLSLDQEKMVQTLNRKYGSSKDQGVNLLIKLLVDRYFNRYP